MPERSPDDWSGGRSKIARAHQARFIAGAPGFDAEPERTLDEGIVDALWVPYDEILARRDEHRSPLVLRCIEDYRAGRRWPLDLVQDVVGHGAGLVVR